MQKTITIHGKRFTGKQLANLVESGGSKDMRVWATFFAQEVGQPCEAWIGKGDVFVQFFNEESGQCHPNKATYALVELHSLNGVQVKQVSI